MYINIAIHSLDLITFLAGAYKIGDLLLAIVGLVCLWLSETTFDEVWYWWGIGLAMVGIQQELFCAMRQKCAEYITRKAALAVFQPETIIDGYILGKINFPEDEVDYWALYIGKEELDFDRQYSGLSLFISYDKRGQPNHLLCQ